MECSSPSLWYFNQYTFNAKTNDEKKKICIFKRQEHILFLRSIYNQIDREQFIQYMPSDQTVAYLSCNLSLRRPDGRREWGREGEWEKKASVCVCVCVCVTSGTSRQRAFKSTEQIIRTRPTPPSSIPPSHRSIRWHHRKKIIQTIIMEFYCFVHNKSARRKYAQMYINTVTMAKCK